MDRRSYLGSLAGAGALGLAGCLDSVGGFGNSDTALGPPDREQDLSKAVHPIHGDEFPSFSIPDALADEAVSRDDFVGDRAFLMTFIFTSCTDECGTLVNLCKFVQDDAISEGYDDDIAFLLMTFDPETDDSETLREYGRERGADVDAENWRFLRPETQEQALELVNETFGAPVDVQPPQKGDHYDDGNESTDANESADANESVDSTKSTDSHNSVATSETNSSENVDSGGGTDSTGETNSSEETDETDSSSGGGHDGDNQGDDSHSHESGDGEGHAGHGTTHYYMIFLVNEDGIVERSYPMAHRQTPTDVIDDVQTVVGHDA